MSTQSATFGTELWDNIGVIEQYTQEGIDFLGKVSDFAKRRAQIEQEYAKSLVKLTEQFKDATPISVKKKSGKFGKSNDALDSSVQASTMHGWDMVLAQTEMEARIHTNGAQFIEAEIVAMIKNNAKNFENNRRQHLNDFKQSKAELKKIYDNLDKVKRNYEIICKAADEARNAFEKADKDLNVTKGQVDKLRDEANIKASKSEEANSEFKKSITETNEHQNYHYQQELPKIINQLQSLEESRVDFMKTVLTKYAGAFLNGVPEKTESYSRIMDAANAINPVSDSQLFIKQNRTGQALPAAIVYESYWDKEGKKTDKKKTKVDYEDVLEAMAPEKAYKKAQTRLKELEKELADMEKKHAGMKTLAEAYISQPLFANSKTLRDLEQQLDETETNIDTLRLKRYKYQLFAAKADNIAPPETPSLFADSKPGVLASKLRGTVLNGVGISETQLTPAVDQSAPTGSSSSNNNISQTVKPFIPHKIKVLYEFVGNAAEGELSVATGETVHIIQPEVEGWVKVRSAKNQEGFVPASYLDGM